MRRTAKPRRIYLTGFMGAGKSSVGRRLAKRLGWKFFDLDAEIERREARTIAEIFREHGEPHFRHLERHYLKDLAAVDRAVIALGGGAFIDPETRKVIEDTGLTVWLKVSFDKVVTRVKMNGARPLFADRDQAEKLLHDREPYYSMATVHISTDEQTADAAANEILGVVRSL